MTEMIYEEMRSLEFETVEILYYSCSSKISLAFFLKFNKLLQDGSVLQNNYLAIILVLPKNFKTKICFKTFSFKSSFFMQRFKHGLKTEIIFVSFYYACIYYTFIS